MEPTYSLQSHIFNHLSTAVYRDINVYNPLNITHPPRSDFLDSIYSSPTADNDTSSIDMIIPQDCGGFSLGSFFTRRSLWTDRLLDIWWDPVLYEQKHMQWEHKEQDALEHLYKTQPWVRTRVAFIEQRMINSYPSGACRDVKKIEALQAEKQTVSDPAEDSAVGSAGDPVDPVDGDYLENEDEEFLNPRVHYRATDRDFTINLAGCFYGRDCWAEMYHYRELSKKLNQGGVGNWKTWWRSAGKADTGQGDEVGEYGQ